MRGEPVTKDTARKIGIVCSPDSSDSNFSEDLCEDALAAAVLSGANQDESAGRQFFIFVLKHAATWDDANSTDTQRAFEPEHRKAIDDALQYLQEKELQGPLDSF